MAKPGTELTASIESGTAAIDDSTFSDVDREHAMLSRVSEMYDMNGDGILDETERAMRNLDETGRGHLSNEKVYNLMHE
jgi:hypothetical protein